MTGFAPIDSPHDGGKRRQDAKGKPDPPVPAIEPFKPFPTDVFPAPLRRLVEVGSKVIGCDPSFIALPALAVLASCIGNTTRVLLKRGWVEACVIWCAVVA